jgi:hypothetical protein
MESPSGGEYDADKLLYLTGNEAWGPMRCHAVHCPSAAIQFRWVWGPGVCFALLPVRRSEKLIPMGAAALSQPIWCRSQWQRSGRQAPCRRALSTSYRQRRRAFDVLQAAICLASSTEPDQPCKNQVFVYLGSR